MHCQIFVHNLLSSIYLERFQNIRNKKCKLKVAHTLSKWFSLFNLYPGQKPVLTRPGPLMCAHNPRVKLRVHNVRAASHECAQNHERDHRAHKMCAMICLRCAVRSKKGPGGQQRKWSVVLINPIPRFFSNLGPPRLPPRGPHSLRLRPAGGPWLGQHFASLACSLACVR